MCAAKCMFELGVFCQGEFEAAELGGSELDMRKSLLKVASAWFSEGLRFSCTQCGKCCKSPDKHVWVGWR